MKAINIFKGKCPNCNTGDIFSSKGNSILFRMPEMRKICKNCNYKFEVEPGFFYGAMFVSYALACAQMIACFVITWAILKIPIVYIFLSVVSIALLSSAFNFRLSRTIWMYLFYKKR